MEIVLPGLESCVVIKGRVTPPPPNYWFLFCYYKFQIPVKNSYLLGRAAFKLAWYSSCNTALIAVIDEIHRSLLLSEY
jgi:hypothetical protein